MYSVEGVEPDFHVSTRNSHFRPKLHRQYIFSYLSILDVPVSSHFSLGLIIFKVEKNIKKSTENGKEKIHDFLPPSPWAEANCVFIGLVDTQGNEIGRIFVK